MSTRRDNHSRLIVAAQVSIGLVVLLGLLAFLSLNPYLITIYAFTQVFMMIGVALFVIALIIRPSVMAEEQALGKATDSDDSGDRIYVVKSGRLQVVNDASGKRRDLAKGDSLLRDRNRRAK